MTHKQFTISAAKHRFSKEAAGVWLYVYVVKQRVDRCGDSGFIETKRAGQVKWIVNE